MTQQKIVLVGMGPGSDDDPPLALSPWVANSTGARLAELTGFDPQTYLDTFARINLCGTAEFDWRAAQHMAQSLRCCGLLEGRKVVCLGPKVWYAFMEDREVKLCVWHGRYAWIPHPSGRNRWYNDPENRARVQEFFRGCL